MTTYRVTAEFDLHINDWPAARENAVDFMRTQKANAEAEGGRVEIGGGPPGETPDQGMLRIVGNDKVAASTVVAFLLAAGARDLGGLEVGNLKHSVDEIA